MAVGLSIRFADGTQEQYDAVNAEMGIAENPPDGLIFHAAGPIKDGWGVIDFWESRAQFDQFLGEPPRPRDPGARRRGAAQGPPEIKEFPVHNI